MSRTRPVWAVFDGGPLHGERVLLSPTVNRGEFIEYTPLHAWHASPTRTPHVYTLTDEKRAGGHHEAAARVAKYVRTLPTEPTPEPVQTTSRSV